jgi:RNA polymerase sigma-70 factor (ECF subfamily)
MSHLPHAPAPAPGALAPAGVESLLLEALPAAYGYALRLTRERADAEDLVQEAALLAVRSAGSFEPGTNFKAWFFRILTNCFRSRHRAAKRRPATVELDDATPLYLYSHAEAAGLPHDAEDPARALLDALGTERIVDAIGALPEEFAVVCTLYFMNDFAYHEIAEVLELPIGTVRSRLHRGRKLLQRALWQAAEDAGIVRGMATGREDGR